MNVTNFLAAYNEPRNGANQFFRHPLMRVFTYSDGVQAVAESGMYWLVDLAAFELTMKLSVENETLGVITLKVKDSEGSVVMTGSGDRRLFRRKLDYTDAPDGEWTFYLAYEQHAPDEYRYAMILPTEY